MKQIINGLSHSPQPKKQTEFVWRNRRFLFPRVARNLFDQPQPLSEITAEEFCHASDLYVRDPLKYAPLIVALLCRAENETYNEQRVEKRAKQMREIPFPIVQQATQQLVDAHHYFRTRFPGCYTDKQNIRQQTAHPATSQPQQKGWYDMLLWVANYTPSEIRETAKMNLYLFMQLLECRLKNRQSNQKL